MTNWQTARLPDCLEKSPKTAKIPKRQFKDSGAYPIVSQEKALINGYWDDRKDVVDIDRPLVVFGDHTQVVKLIDFNFVVGADGVKLLKPKPFLDCKYFYYYLLGHPLKSLGYARHFRLLKDLEVVFPPLAEQKRIIAILDEAFAGIETAIANTENNFANARELFESYLAKVFRQRDNWKFPTLEDLCHIARGGSPRPIKKFLTEDPDGVNWIKISDATASSKYIYETRQKIKPEGIKRSRGVQEGDFLLSNSMSFGRPYIMRTSGCIHDGWLVLRDKSGLYDQDYLYYFLGSAEAFRQFDSRASGSTVRNLNIDLVRSVEVPLPPVEEQRRLAKSIEEFFGEREQLERVHRSKLAALSELKQSLLHKAFSGELTSDGADREVESATA